LPSQRFWMLAGVLVLAAAPVQCPNTDPNTVIYTTQPGDTPYRLADRVYGHGYLETKILAANLGKLGGDGVYPAGTLLTLPPDDAGHPAQINGETKKHYRAP